MLFAETELPIRSREINERTFIGLKPSRDIQSKRIMLNIRIVHIEYRDRDYWLSTRIVSSSELIFIQLSLLTNIVRMLEILLIWFLHIYPFWFYNIQGFLV